MANRSPSRRTAASPFLSTANGGIGGAPAANTLLSFFAIGGAGGGNGTNTTPNAGGSTLGIARAYSSLADLDGRSSGGASLGNGGAGLGFPPGLGGGGPGSSLQPPPFPGGNGIVVIAFA